MSYRLSIAAFCTTYCAVFKILRIHNIKLKPHLYYLYLSGLKATKKSFSEATEWVYISEPQTLWVQHEWVKSFPCVVCNTELAGVPDPAHRTRWSWIQTKQDVFVYCADHRLSLGVYSEDISCTLLSGTGSVWNLTGHANLSANVPRKREKKLVLMYWNVCVCVCADP